MSQNMNPEWSKGSAVGLRTQPAWEKVCRLGLEYFVSTMLRKLDLGVSKHVKQSAEDNDPVSRFSSPKAFQNPK